RGDDDHAGVGRDGGDLRNRVEAVLAREQQVKQHEVGLERAGTNDRLLCGVSFADDLDPGLLLEPAPQTRAKQLVIIDEQDTRRHQRPPNPSLALVPPSARGESSIWAPKVPATRRESSSPTPDPDS